MFSSYIRRQYGCKSGWYRHHLHRLLFFFGKYDRLTRPDLRDVERLVFVCHGNICRSPYAEARAQREGLVALSFGVDTEGGKPPYPTAQQVAKERGLDLKPHRSRTMAGISIQSGDLLLGMEPWHAKCLLNRYPEAQVGLLGLWCSSSRPHLEDPYGLSESYFNTCFGLIDEAVRAISEELNAAA